MSCFFLFVLSNGVFFFSHFSIIKFAIAFYDNDSLIYQPNDRKPFSISKFQWKNLQKKNLVNDIKDNSGTTVLFVYRLRRSITSKSQKFASIYCSKGFRVLHCVFKRFSLMYLCVNIKKKTFVIRLLLFIFCTKNLPPLFFFLKCGCKSESIVSVDATVLSF